MTFTEICKNISVPAGHFPQISREKRERLPPISSSRSTHAYMYASCSDLVALFGARALIHTDSISHIDAFVQGIKIERGNGQEPLSDNVVFRERQFA